ncbi:bifunctional RNase H/acid phosphatase [Pilimelia anulata]|uniref:Bifunctional RNase H/acid phosphatase n=1 Tax=Pilimelia anulata TaxID=53371 RepID=A0A8J3F977_9ACTN|nr:bifunctional RNase H/acid phosphatase [Pilimelia anulata]GGJ84373.1 bifunctional RNase H/acid phosphatase [Pilimelia anulata]
MKRLRVIVEADGGSRGNPGPAGYGAVVREAGTGEILLERAEAIGIATNNVAEYSGLIAGLRAAADLGAVEVEVRMDSKLVVEQMNGRWQIKHPGLRPLAAEAAALVRRFDSVAFGWIPRARNTDADRLANEAMDAAAGKPPKARRDPGPALFDEPPPGPVGAVGGGVVGRTAGGRGGSGAAGAGQSGAAWTGAARAGRSGGSAARPAVDPSVVAGAGERLRLILVRHGETDRTRQRRYAGRTDSLLTAHGRAQAKAVAARIAELAPDLTAVRTSPLSRCAATAEAIAAAAGGVPVKVEPDLVECDFGDWDGLTYAQVRERWADLHDRWLAATDVAPPHGETFADVGRRVGRLVDRLRADHPTGTVVLVSHVSPLKLILRDALGATDALLHRLYLDPAGVSVIDTWPDGGIAVRTVNDTAHLPPTPA